MKQPQPPANITAEAARWYRESANLYRQQRILTWVQMFWPLALLLALMGIGFAVWFWAMVFHSLFGGWM